MDKGPIQVLIVDDEAMIRKGVAALLKGYEEIRVIGDAANAFRAIELVKNLKPDVVVSDLLLPMMDGIETIRQIATIQPDLHVIVLTDHTRDDLFFQSIQAGAQGYLSKDCHPDELVEAIVNVYAGVPSFSQSVAWRALHRMTDVPDTKHNSNTLSQREMDVLRLLTMGKTDYEIGEELIITPVTARTHVKRIITKLGVRNRVEAALYGLRTGLVSLSEVDCLGSWQSDR